MDQDTLIIVLLVYAALHLLAAFFNFGVSLAYFDRFNLGKKALGDELARRLALAFCAAAMGPYATLSVLVKSDMLAYGFKLWTGEVESSRNKWWERLRERERVHALSQEMHYDSIERHRMRFKKPRIKEQHLKGCISFWQYV